MKHFFKLHLSRAQHLSNHKWLRFFGSSLSNPSLWHLNRHSVSRGVAIGLFCGLIPGPFQMLGAAVLCVVLRANLPCALLFTLYTNPLTIIPIYWFAYSIGSWILGAGQFVKPPPVDWGQLFAWFDAIWVWAQTLGKPLVVGLTLLAVVLSAAGYMSIYYGWRMYVIRAWKKRAQRHM